MKARVHVYLKPGVLDPQGQAVATSLKHLGFDEVAAARQGKLIEIDLNTADAEEAQKTRRRHVRQATRQPGDRNLRH